jgi:hypothetical protein
MLIDQRLNALLDTDELEVTTHRIRIEAFARLADHVCRAVISKDPFRHTRPLLEKARFFSSDRSPISALNGAAREGVWTQTPNLTIGCIAFPCKPLVDLIATPRHPPPYTARFVAISTQTGSAPTVSVAHDPPFGRIRLVPKGSHRRSRPNAEAACASLRSTQSI